MQKNIKDYLHLYLPFEFLYFGIKYKVIGFRNKGHFFTFWHEHGFFDVLNKDFKLPLRPLSDLAEEEEYELEMIGHQLAKEQALHYQFYAQRTKYLLSKHFDIFGLIESGLAINKATIKN